MTPVLASSALAALALRALVASTLPALLCGVRRMTSAHRLTAESQNVSRSIAEDGATLGAGSLLHGRYRLESRLRGRDSQRGVQGVKDGVGSDVSEPEIHYPELMPKKFHVSNHTRNSKEHLGTGSFGDVWKATDTITEKQVAVKIFFIGDEYITGTLARANRKQLYPLLQDAEQECIKVKVLLESQAAKNDPIGASRICNCFEAHVSSSKLGETFAVHESSEPLFIVQEMCGDSLWNVRDSPGNMTPKQVLTELIQGIGFLSSQGLVHRDLKLENVNVHKGAIKLIDFGGMLKFPDDVDKEYNAACTPEYTPKEVRCGYIPNFDPKAPCSAYDSYSAAVMYWELACETLRPCPARETGSCPSIPMRNDGPTCVGGSAMRMSSSERKVIASLLSDDPRVRMSPDDALKILKAPPLTARRTRAERNAEAARRAARL